MGCFPAVSGACPKPDPTPDCARQSSSLDILDELDKSRLLDVDATTSCFRARDLSVAHVDAEKVWMRSYFSIGVYKTPETYGFDLLPLGGPFQFDRLFLLVV